ncbi:hypothetical protein JCM3765_007063 [Sporobolomyces pararoseus]
MQPVASTSASTPFQLTEPNLRSHTSLEGIAPRRTVQIYLQGIKQAQGYFELPSAPILDSDSSPPSRPSNLNLLEQHESKRRRLNQVEAEERFDGKDTALVMHQSGRAPRGKESQQGILKTRAPTVPLKKKPSLVSAMRPRLATAPDRSSSSPLKSEPRLKDGKRKMKLDSREKENHRREDETEGKQSRAKQKATEQTEEQDVIKSFRKGKGKLRSEVENEEEAAELEERLEARKERRRNKAFIRKDHSQSATATGVAAASKLKKVSKKYEHEVEEGDSNDSELEEEKGRKTKKGRKTAEQSGRELIQGLERPRAVGTGRLTLKPSNQLGLFNKGKASARVKVGKAVPDLAFSEMRFLNSTRPTPASASDSESVPPDQEAPVQKKASKHSRERETYSSQASLRQRSRVENYSSSSLSDVDDLPPPPKPRISTKDSQKKDSSRRRETSPRTAPLHRQDSSHVALPPPSRTSSRSSRRLRNMEPTSAVLEEAPRPPQEAIDFAAQEESNFSAHSAHSLAMRRRSQVTVQKKTNEEQRIETVVEEQPRELPEENKEETVNKTPVVPTAEMIFSPLAAPSPIPIDNADPVASPVVKSPKKRSAPASSIRTESIDQILRDNASTAQTHLESDPASLPASSIHYRSVSQANLQTFPLHPPIRSYSHHSRSRSSSAAFSYRSQASLITRQRSLSEAAAHNYEGPALETFNPFAPSNFVHSSQAYNTSSGGGESSNQALPPDDYVEFQYPGSQEAFELEGEGEVETFEGNPPQLAERFSPLAIQEGTFGRMEEPTYETELKEEMIAKLWHKNIL